MDRRCRACDSSRMRRRISLTAKLGQGRACLCAGAAGACWAPLWAWRWRQSPGCVRSVADALPDERKRRDAEIRAIMRFPAALRGDVPERRVRGAAIRRPQYRRCGIRRWRPGGALYPARSTMLSCRVRCASGSMRGDRRRLVERRSQASSFNLSETIMTIIHGRPRAAVRRRWHSPHSSAASLSLERAGARFALPMRKQRPTAPTGRCCRCRTAATAPRPRRFGCRSPEGVIGVRPMPKAGWTLTTTRGAYAKPYENHGRTVSEGVKEIVWSGGSLADDHFDEFTFAATIATDGGAAKAVYFPTVQQCAKGEAAWTEIPAAGQSARDLKKPAPAVRISAKTTVAQAGGGHDHHGRGRRGRRRHVQGRRHHHRVAMDARDAGRRKGRRRLSEDHQQRHGRRQAGRRRRPTSPVASKCTRWRWTAA